MSQKEQNQVIPPTFGGPGWRVRTQSHRRDVHEGEFWQRCGVNTEWNELRSVMLSWPSEAFAVEGDAEANLLLSWPDQQQLQEQCLATRDFFDSNGVTVHLHRPYETPPINYLFMRDLVFMTPEGAVLGRPASPLRAPEVRFAQEALADAGIPIIHMIRGSGTLEGADCLWIRPDCVLVGIGTRTNVAGAAALQHVLSGMQVQTQTVALPSGVQHLLGVVWFLDKDLAAIDSGRITPEITSTLAAFGIETIAVPRSVESGEKRGMNGVTLAPREVVIPTGCPGITQQLQEAGVRVHSIDVSAYIQAAGALGCMTSILERK